MLCCVVHGHSREQYRRSIVCWGGGRWGRAKSPDFVTERDKRHPRGPQHPRRGSRTDGLAAASFSAPGSLCDTAVLDDASKFRTLRHRWVQPKTACLTVRQGQARPYTLRGLNRARRYVQRVSQSSVWGALIYQFGAVSPGQFCRKGWVLSIGENHVSMNEGYYDDVILNRRVIKIINLFLCAIYINNNSLYINI